jgi:hypothetical protein
MFKRILLEYKTVEIPSNAMASVTDFSPVTFSAQKHLTSELLRTL